MMNEPTIMARSRAFSKVGYFLCHVAVRPFLLCRDSFIASIQQHNSCDYSGNHAYGCGKRNDVFVLFLHGGDCT